MITLDNKKYKLFFSNNLPPLIALNYADELFLKEFKKLLGEKYRILSIIKHGWQEKYGLLKDIEKLEKHFRDKIRDDKWVNNLLPAYNNKSSELKKILSLIAKKDYSKLNNKALISEIKKVRSKSAVLDAMSNMLHLFSSLVGADFFESLHKYTDDKKIINQNFIFYTQPIKESRFAKIKKYTITNKIRLSKTDQNISNIIRIGAFVKDDVSFLLDLRKKSMAGIFQEISKRIKCQVKDLDYLQIGEIEVFLLNKKVPSVLIKERKQITILFYPKNKLKVFEGNDAKYFLKKNLFCEIIEKKIARTLFGQIASLGKIKGRVIIANNSKEANNKMRKGKILVAPYTAVEYVPAMKKAAAIITETGGITSHAAIVSREYNIPCIIGVHRATKILKNNQEIIVDADKGLIELL